MNYLSLYEDFKSTDLESAFELYIEDKDFTATDIYLNKVESPDANPDITQYYIRYVHNQAGLLRRFIGDVDELSEHLYPILTKFYDRFCKRFDLVLDYVYIDLDIKLGDEITHEINVTVNILDPDNVIRSL